MPAAVIGSGAADRAESGGYRVERQTRADYAALREPFYLSKLIDAEYLPSRIIARNGIGRKADTAP
jgi:hypothetical protein